MRVHIIQLVSGAVPKVTIGEEHDDDHDGDHQHQHHHPMIMSMNGNDKWVDSNKSRIQNLQKFWQSIVEQGPVQKLSLFFTSIPKCDIKRILSVAEFSEWKNCYLQGDIHMDALRFVMDRATMERQIILDGGVMVPADFQHENTFKFGRCLYSNAFWVRPESLLEIRDVKECGLGRSNLTSEDVHCFLRYLMNSEHPVVVNWIEIAMKARQTIDKDVLMRDFIGFEVQQTVATMIVVKSKNPVSTKIAFIKTLNNTLTVTVKSDPNKNLREIMKLIEELMNRLEHDVKDVEKRKKILEKLKKEFRVEIRNGHAWTDMCAGLLML